MAPFLLRERDRRIEQACAVDVGRELVAPGQFAHRAHVVWRQDLAASGVFQHYQTGAREVRIVRLDGGRDGIQRDRAVRLVFQHLRLDRTEHGHAACFPTVGVPLLADDGFVAALAVRHQRDQIGLGAAGREQGGLETQHLGGGMLQAVDARIITEYVVAQRCFEHGLLHCRRRAGHGVAAEVAHWGEGKHG